VSYVKRDAIFSNCGRYRYTLTRVWDQSKQNLLICMLNPSIASDEEDDPTIKKVIKFAKKYNFGSVTVVNLFAQISTDPRRLAENKDPIGPDNDMYIRDSLRKCHSVWIAWGTNAERYQQRVQQVMSLLRDRNIDIYCLGKSKDGHPSHPVMLSYNSPLEIFYCHNKTNQPQRRTLKLPEKQSKLKTPDPVLMNKNECQEIVTNYFKKFKFSNTVHTNSKPDVILEKMGWNVLIEARGNQAVTHDKDTVFDTSQISTHLSDQVFNLMRCVQQATRQTFFVIANPDVPRIRNQVAKITKALKELKTIQIWIKEDHNITIEGELAPELMLLLNSSYDHVK
jgi:hypothetical protein